MYREDFDEVSHGKHVEEDGIPAQAVAVRRDYALQLRYDQAAPGEEKKDAPRDCEKLRHPDDDVFTGQLVQVEAAVIVPENIVQRVVHRVDMLEGVVCVIRRLRPDVVRSGEQVSHTQHQQQ
jgi:hypothetical protein